MLYLNFSTLNFAGYDIDGLEISLFPDLDCDDPSTILTPPNGRFEDLVCTGLQPSTLYRFTLNSFNCDDTESFDYSFEVWTRGNMDL